ncbi:MAG: permease-like cell division protein FtsX [Prevotella sp.]|jgi:cell division transport system permease protein|nr:permease-like cell division protein FtsX [Prevotella sp.]MCI1282879.1 permease-like cell division protein FtsX [Prevotella sp.]
MGKSRNKTSSRQGLQVVTLCISTAMVLILLGLVVFSVLTTRNLSSYVKENLVVTMMLEQDMTNSEAQQLCQRLNKRPYINHLQFISKEQALREQTKAMGSDPSEFIGGENPFLSSIEITLKADYANNDSLKWISKELRKYPKISDVSYQKALIDSVNQSLAKISFGLLILAALLTFVLFSLINNTVRLGIYARRFSIHTMKLVGASWNFIRKPFVKQAVVIGIVAALLACLILAGCVFALYQYEPGTLTVVTWQVMAITAAAVFLFGIIITAICANISVNKFLKMKAGELYKI